MRLPRKKQTDALLRKERRGTRLGEMKKKKSKGQGSQRPEGKPQKEKVTRKRWGGNAESRNYQRKKRKVVKNFPEMNPLDKKSGNQVLGKIAGRVFKACKTSEWDNDAKRQAYGSQGHRQLSLNPILLDCNRSQILDRLVKRSQARGDTTRYGPGLTDYLRRARAGADASGSS